MADVKIGEVVTELVVGEGTGPLGPEDLRKINPRLIYVEVNAYGFQGPWAERRGWEQLAQAIPHLALNGHLENCLPNTLNVRFPRVSGEALLVATPQIAASTGSACHDGGESASAVLLAMGIPAKAALGSVRLTLGRATTESAVDRASAALARAWRALVLE